MITNPLLEEIWDIKDRLNANSGGDIHIFCQQVRDWSAKNMPEGMVVCHPTELRALLAKNETEGIPLLREEPPEYGVKQN